MNKRILKISVALFLTTIVLGICSLAASVNLSAVGSTSTQSKVIDIVPDMLVFLSPQYSNDKDIDSAINSYASVVNSDIGWNIKIIKIRNDQNNYKIVDEIIEEHFEKFRIKACIMVGEDTDTALSGSNDYMRKPSTIPWETIGGEDSYETIDNKIVCKPYKIDVCISLLYPTSDLDFETKKMQIISAFNKFSRNKIYYFIEVFDSFFKLFLLFFHCSF